MKHNRVFTQTFGVVGAIIEKDGKILLVKEKGIKGYDQGKWNQPAGWLDVGEDPIEAVKREVKEETGYDFEPEHIVGVYSLYKTYKTTKEPTRHAIKIIFSGKISGKPSALADDIAETKWFTPEKIYQMTNETLRDLDIKQEVRDYFNNIRYPIDLVRHTKMTI